MRAVLLALLAIGCGGRSAPPPPVANKPVETKPVDDCERFITKATPILLETMAAGGKAMPEAELVPKLREECAQMRTSQNIDPAFTCVLDAVDQPAVRACFAAAFAAYQGSARKPEASLQLNKLAKNAKVYFITTSAFPVGSSALMPATPCCGQPDNKCAVIDTWAKTPIWTELDFQLDEPHRFQYSIQSSAQKLTAQAVGDLDCDGIMVTYKLEVTTSNGNPTATITEPLPNSD